MLHSSLQILEKKTKNVLENVFWIRTQNNSMCLHEGETDCHGGRNDNVSSFSSRVSGQTSNVIEGRRIRWFTSYYLPRIYCNFILKLKTPNDTRMKECSEIKLLIITTLVQSVSPVVFINTNGHVCDYTYIVDCLLISSLKSLLYLKFAKNI